MTIEKRAPSLVGVGIQSTVETSKRLGLTWGLVPATVSASTAASSTVSVVLDGDSEPIDAVNLLGGWPQVGARVMVVQVPPGGTFIVGHALTGYVANRLTYDAIAPASAQLILGAAATLVPGVTHTVIVANAGRYVATGVFDFDETGAGGTVCVGELYVDGSVEPTGSQALFEVLVATDRATVTQQWAGTLAAGSHLFEGRARRSAAVGTQAAQATHTTLRVQVYE